jgi:hypothetical protein
LLLAEKNERDEEFVPLLPESFDADDALIKLMLFTCHSIIQSGK